MTLAVIAVAVVLGLIAGAGGASVRTRRLARGREAAAQRSRQQHEAQLARQEEALQTRRESAERDIERLREAGAAEVAALRSSADAEADLIRRSAEVDATAIRQAAERTAERADEDHRRRTAELDAREAALRTEADRADATVRARAAELAKRERELTAAGDALAERERAHTARAAAVADAEQALVERAAELERREQELAARADEHTRELARVAGLSQAAARTELLAAVEVTARRDAAALARRIEEQARAEADAKARAVVVEAVQRVASDQTSETVVSVVALPSEEMKGRIIGREGRNVRSFEAVTGVNVIIDDTPEAVLLSCFDPLRREIGRLTLERLMADGRIHPHRIEEAHARSREEVEALCLRAADDALAEVGITDLDPALRPVLGRLRYRTSYGQNVLGHLVESAHLAGIMAAELGLEPAVFKRCAFLHDIGKAFTHEVEGTHAVIGAALLRRHGESEVVAHAVEAHHDEVPARSLEDVLTQAADACSAARPGARRESLESYVKRLDRIEQIASARPGVEKVFAMQAGRELRVMVTPAEVDDDAAHQLAREIAQQIEGELTYPGQIRVTVVRESRSTEIAH